MIVDTRTAPVIRASEIQRRVRVQRVSVAIDIRVRAVKGDYRAKKIRDGLLRRGIIRD